MCRLALIDFLPAALCAGASAAGAAGAVGSAAGADDDGDGPCAQTGAAIARTAAMATPVKRCFMLVVLYGSSGFDTTGYGVLS